MARRLGLLGGGRGWGVPGNVSPFDVHGINRAYENFLPHITQLAARHGYYGRGAIIHFLRDRMRAQALEGVKGDPGKNL
jgi:hypothetical protein